MVLYQLKYIFAIVDFKNNIIFECDDLYELNFSLGNIIVRGELFVKYLLKSIYKALQKMYNSFIKLLEQEAI